MNCFCGMVNQQDVNPLSANPTKCSNTLKQFVGFLSTNYLRLTNCLSAFDHLWGWHLKGYALF